MLNRALTFPIFFFLAFSAVTFLRGQDSLRKWQAASGNFSVQAELVELQGDDKVLLKKADGSTILVELKKLSEADVEFVQQWRTKREKPQPEPKPDRDDDNVSANSDNGKSKSPSVAAGKKGSASSAKKGTTKDSSAFDSQSKPRFAENLELLAGQVSSLELTVPVTHSSYVGWHIRDNSGTFGYVADLANGKISPAFSLSKSIEGKALSPDGSLYATFGGTVTAITFYPVNSDQPTFDIKPVEFSSLGSIAFLNSKELLVFGRSQVSGAAVYDITKGRMVRWIEAPTTLLKYNVSSDGTLLALHQGQEVLRVVDTKTGKGKTEIKLTQERNSPPPQIQTISFCNANRDLAVLTSENKCGLRIYDSKSGKLKHKHFLKQSIKEIAWFWEEYRGPAVEELPDNRGWMLFGVAVVDSELGGPVWNQKGPLTSQMSIFQPLATSQSQIALIGDSDSKTFKSLPIPWDEIETARTANKE